MHFLPTIHVPKYWEVNNYIVRSYSDVIAVANIVTRKSMPLVRWPSGVRC